jgi:ABC-type branched-subunit amino acid transport system substrate-binding protein/branched-subunit amino acid ABC-type transport system permease component
MAVGETISRCKILTTPRRVALCFSISLAICLLAAGSLASAQTTPELATFEPLKGDMSDFDPSNQVFPTSGDTIKVGLFWPFSGPLALGGQIYWAIIGWVVHDINSQGGIVVDGKRKMIQLIAADNQGKVATARRVMERLCLEDDVDLIIGGSGTHLSLVGQQMAARYKKIFVNVNALTDSLMDEENFNRYTFRTCPTTSMLARALARFYANRPEKRYYILCQDYSYGHAFGETFAASLLRLKSDAVLVGQDYHPLGATDYAPYLEKARGYRAEVIITGDHSADGVNLTIQSAQMNLGIPLAGPFMDSPNAFRAIGGPAGEGMLGIWGWNMSEPRAWRLVETWNEQWKRWDTLPYTGDLFRWPGGVLGQWTQSTYWLFDVLAAAGSSDPEEIIEAFENSEYEIFGHRVTMRPSDHQAVMDLHVGVMVFPNKWFDAAAGLGPVTTIPAKSAMPPEPASVASFEPLKGDMSDFDPANQVFPTSGDTIKVGMFWPFSGPMAITGQTAWATIGWAVHDINSQGGIKVDGRMKKIQLVKGDHQGKPATGKRVIEKLCLEDEVDMIIGASPSHLSLIAQQVAAKHRKIYANVDALSDALMDEENFNRYTFRTCPTTTTLARALAGFYARRPEKRFYILCQDYLYGHAFGEAFKMSLLAQRPDAIIVGEDYHPLGATNYAPYLTKADGYNAEVIVTGDFPPDSDNLIRQSRQLGMTVPLAGPFVDLPTALKAIGGPAGEGLVAVSGFNLASPDAQELQKSWNALWGKWKALPYSGDLYEWPVASATIQTHSAYWLFDVLARAGSTDSEKIIQAFEGSEYEAFGHRVKMRASDHETIRDMYASELVFPNEWHEDRASWGPADTIPAESVMRSEMAAPRRESEAASDSAQESPRASMYVSQAIHGLTYGMLLFLVASGLTLIFGMMGVLNLAHASFFMLGGYLCYQILSMTGNFWLCLLIVPGAVGLLGILMERTLIRKAQSHGLGHVGELLLTLGVALVISEGVKAFWGTEGLAIAMPESLAGMVTVAGLEYPVYRLFVVALALFILCILAAVLFKTRLGAIVRAVVSDADMVGALGINVSRVSMLVFGIGTWMAGVAGVAAAPLLTVHPGLADQVGLEAIVVVVVGGLGNLIGAFVVSLIMGEMNAFGITFIPRLAPVLTFAFMAIVMSLRPMGFFGERK